MKINKSIIISSMSILSVFLSGQLFAIKGIEIKNDSTQAVNFQVSNGTKKVTLNPGERDFIPTTGYGNRTITWSIGKNSYKTPEYKWPDLFVLAKNGKIFDMHEKWLGGKKDHKNQNAIIIYEEQEKKVETPLISTSTIPSGQTTPSIPEISAKETKELMDYQKQINEIIEIINKPDLDYELVPLYKTICQQDTKKYETILQKIDKGQLKKIEHYQKYLKIIKDLEKELDNILDKNKKDDGKILDKKDQKIESNFVDVSKKNNEELVRSFYEFVYNTALFDKEPEEIRKKQATQAKAIELYIEKLAEEITKRMKK